MAARQSFVAPDKAAVKVAGEQIDWALRQGWTVPQILAQIGLPPLGKSSLPEAVAAYAVAWRAMHQPQTTQAVGGRAALTKIVAAVCHELKLTPEELARPTRLRAFVNARRYVVVMASLATTLSTSELAAAIGVHPATVTRHLADARERGEYAKAEAAFHSIDLRNIWLQDQYRWIVRVLRGQGLAEALAHALPPRKPRTGALLHARTMPRSRTSAGLRLTVPPRRK